MDCIVDVTGGTEMKRKVDSDRERMHIGKMVLSLHDRKIVVTGEKLNDFTQVLVSCFLRVNFPPFLAYVPL